MSLAARTALAMRWQESFAQLGNTQVESRFADHRTYIYEGKEVDQQTHLEQVREAGVAAAEQVADRIRDGPLVVLDDENSALGAFLHLQEPDEFERADGFSNDDAAYSELRSEFTLRRQPISGLYRRAENELADPVGNFLVRLATAQRLKAHFAPVRACHVGIWPMIQRGLHQH